MPNETPRSIDETWKHYRIVVSTSGLLPTGYTKWQRRTLEEKLYHIHTVPHLVWFWPESERNPGASADMTFSNGELGLEAYIARIRRMLQHILTTDEARADVTAQPTNLPQPPRERLYHAIKGKPLTESKPPTWLIGAKRG